jgi:hypothetical protein
LDNEDHAWLIDFINYLPLYNLMVWSTVKFFGRSDKDLMYYFVSIGFVCFFIPYYWIEPFASYRFFGGNSSLTWFGDDNDAHKYTKNALLLIGALILLEIVSKVFCSMILYFPHNPLIKLDTKK